MLKNIAFHLVTLSPLAAFSQGGAQYRALIHQADSLYRIDRFAACAHAYSDAFGSIGPAASDNDRYNASCCWALAGIPDSAFFQLSFIAGHKDFTDLKWLIADSDLVGLHGDPRWATIVARTKANKDKAEEGMDHVLLAMLDSIGEEDQRYRNFMDVVEKQSGRNSPDMIDLLRTMQRTDSTNLIAVRKVLDERGWLGPDLIGNNGSSTLFLVIQHADLSTQEHYLPMMREAVKAGRARGADLALLEDRVLMRNGKRQRYGSQIGRHPDTGEFFLSPLEDPDHVDERRASVGLGPLSEYVAIWNLTWNVEDYKQQLPALEARIKATLK